MLPADWEHAGRVANALAKSDLVPDAYKGKPANIMVAAAKGQTLGIDLITAMEAIHIIKGKPSLSAQLMIALAGRAGVFSGPIRFVTTGQNQNLAIKAAAKLATSGEDVETTVTLEQAQKMGWTNGKPNWESQPDLMLSYRAASKLIRLYAPGAVLGMVTTDEAMDCIQDAEIVAAQPAAIAALSAIDPEAEAKAKAEAAKKAKVAESIKKAKEADKKADDFPNPAAHPVTLTPPAQEPPAPDRLDTIMTDAKKKAAGLADEHGESKRPPVVLKPGETPMPGAKPYDDFIDKHSSRFD